MIAPAALAYDLRLVLMEPHSPHPGAGWGETKTETAITPAGKEIEPQLGFGRTARNGKDARHL
jgi:hypothetical protein